MKKIWYICRRELLSYFTSPIAYFVLTGFIFVGGYFYLNLLGYFNLIVSRYAAMPFYQGAGAPSLNQWVVEGFYHTLIVILVFLTPLLTMRLLADEKRKGTFELLITSPLSVTDIVLGKFLGVAVITTIMVLASAIFPMLLVFFSDPETPPIISGALGVLLCALSFASIGMAASAFTENQIVAGVSAMVTLLLLYVIHSPADSIGGTLGDVLRYLSPVMQVQDMIRGVISVKSIIYFCSLIFFGLFLTQRAIEANRWR